jgi:MerR family redox-sensitive transcriptional activator SoxR
MRLDARGTTSSALEVKMETLDIGEVARRLRLSAATLRFYEDEGLIQSVGRKGLRRLYAKSVIERLTLIGLGRAAGFSLKEVGAMLDSPSRPRIDKKRLAARAAVVDAQIRELTFIRDGLLHAAECEAPDLMECPHFRQVLRRAEQGRIAMPPAPSKRSERPSKASKAAKHTSKR